jgi:hypothetical protein
MAVNDKQNKITDLNKEKEGINEKIEKLKVEYDIEYEKNKHMYSGDSDTPQRMTKDIRINMEINTLKLSINIIDDKINKLTKEIELLSMDPKILQGYKDEYDELTRQEKIIRERKNYLRYYI